MVGEGGLDMGACGICGVAVKTRLVEIGFD